MQVCFVRNQDAHPEKRRSSCVSTVALACFPTSIVVAIECSYCGNVISAVRCNLTRCQITQFAERGSQVVRNALRQARHSEFSQRFAQVQYNCSKAVCAACPASEGPSCFWQWASFNTLSCTLVELRTVRVMAASCGLFGLFSCSLGCGLFLIGMLCLAASKSPIVLRFTDMTADGHASGSFHAVTWPLSTIIDLPFSRLASTASTMCSRI